MLLKEGIVIMDQDLCKPMAAILCFIMILMLPYNMVVVVDPLQLKGEEGLF